MDPKVSYLQFKVYDSIRHYAPPEIKLNIQWIELYFEAKEGRYIFKENDWDRNQHPEMRDSELDIIDSFRDSERFLRILGRSLWFSDYQRRGNHFMGEVVFSSRGINFDAPMEYLDMAMSFRNEVYDRDGAEDDNFSIPSSGMVEQFTGKFGEVFTIDDMTNLIAIAGFPPADKWPLPDYIHTEDAAVIRGKISEVLHNLPMFVRVFERCQVFLDMSCNVFEFTFVVIYLYYLSPGGNMDTENKRQRLLVNSIRFQDYDAEKFWAIRRTMFTGYDMFGNYFDPRHIESDLEPSSGGRTKFTHAWDPNEHKDIPLRAKCVIGITRDDDLFLSVLNRCHHQDGVLALKEFAAMAILHYYEGP